MRSIHARDLYLSLVMLVSGSREWPAAHDHVIVQAIDAALDAAWASAGVAAMVVGDCPTGVDDIAAGYWHRMGGQLEVCAADWAAYGNAAGPRRNGEMVERVAALAQRGVTTVGLFFPWGRSPGTRNCLRQAREAGLPALRVFEGTELMGTSPPSARGSRWPR